MELFFFFNDTATTEIYTLSLHDALPISKSFRILTLVSVVLRRPECEILGQETNSLQISSQQMQIFYLQPRKTERFIDDHTNVFMDQQCHSDSNR